MREAPTIAVFGLSGAGSPTPTMRSTAPSLPLTAGQRTFRPRTRSPAFSRLISRGRGSRRGKSALTRGVRLEESLWQPVREARDPIAGLATRESLRRGVSKSRPHNRWSPVARRLQPCRHQAIDEARSFGCWIPVAANKSLADPRSVRILSFFGTGLPKGPAVRGELRKGRGEPSRRFAHNLAGESRQAEFFLFFSAVTR
jgi:hypothetical protein